MKAIIYFDGACLPHNPNGIGTYGFIIKNAHNGETIYAGKGVAFQRGTNNMAEYSALLHALEKAIELNIKEVEIYGDSMLVINQINGVYDISEIKLLSLNLRARELLNKFESWKVKWFSREKNKEADKLSIEAFLELIESKNKEKIEKLIGLDIIREGNGIYRVKDYLITLNPPSCNCRYFKKYNNFQLLKKSNVTVKCEHILYVEEKLNMEMNNV